ARGRSRTTRTGSAPRRTETTAPGGTSYTRRPSQNTTARDVYGSTVIRMVDVGAVTTGRLNSVCALIGTTTSAETSGQTTGPPAEKAYAVEPVGVAHTTPSQPYRDSGRSSTSSSSSSIRARSPFSTLTSLSAHDSTTGAPRWVTVMSRVSRSST